MQTNVQEIAVKNVFLVGEPLPPLAWLILVLHACVLCVFDLQNWNFQPSDAHRTQLLLLERPRLGGVPYIWGLTFYELYDR